MEPMVWLDQVDSECNGDSDLKPFVNGMYDYENGFLLAEDCYSKSLAIPTMETVDQLQLTVQLANGNSIGLSQEQEQAYSMICNQYLNDFNETTATTGDDISSTAATVRPANVTSNVEQLNVDLSQYLPASVQGVDVDGVLQSPSSTFEEQIDFSTIGFESIIFDSVTAAIAPPPPQSTIFLIPSATPATSLPGNRCLPELPNARCRSVKPLSVDTASSTLAAATATMPLAVVNSSLSPDQTVPAEPAQWQTSQALTKTSPQLPRYSFESTGIFTANISTQSGLGLTRSPAVVKQLRLSADTMCGEVATSSPSGVPTMVENDEEITTSVTSPTRIGVKRGRPPSNVTAEADGNPLSEKKERRKKQNREAATRCRDKRKKEHESLIEAHQKTQLANADLKKQLEKIQANFKAFLGRFNQHCTICPCLHDLLVDANMI